MKSFRTQSIHRCIVVAVMVLSWLAITNHCALAWMRANAAGCAEHAHCHGATNENGKKAPGDGMRECCQTIKASLNGGSEAPFAAGAFQLTVWTISPAVERPAEAMVLDFNRDHGPPGASSFAETVLQHSLLSHAPPFVA